MEEKTPEKIGQKEFEAMTMEHAREAIKKNQNPKYSWIPEGIRRVSRFGVYSLSSHIPKDSFNKRYTRSYLPFGMRHHIICLVSAYCLTKYALKKLYPPRY